MTASRCPTCDKPVPTTPADRPETFPFCSRRCQLIDLGEWLDGQYRISSPVESAEQIRDVTEEQQDDLGAGRDDDRP